MRESNFEMVQRVREMVLEPGFSGIGPRRKRAIQYVLERLEAPCRECEELKKQLDSACQEWNEQKTALDQLLHERDAARKELESATTRIKALTGLIDNLVRFPRDEMRNVLTETLFNIKDREIVDLLHQLAESERARKIAVDAVWIRMRSDSELTDYLYMTEKRMIASGKIAPREKLEEAWWEVLGCSPDASQEEIRMAYQRKAVAAHPDLGGSQEAMARVDAARDAAIAELEAE